MNEKDKPNPLSDDEVRRMVKRVAALNRSRQANLLAASWKALVRGIDNGHSHPWCDYAFQLKHIQPIADDAPNG